MHRSYPSSSSASSDYLAMEGMIGGYIPSEWWDDGPTSGLNPASPDEISNASWLGLLGVGVFLAVSTITLIAVTTTMAAMRTIEAPKQIESRMGSTSWDF